jgi:hypothetical protein
MKSASTAGGVFALLLVVSLATLGDLLGSFADPDDAFETHFSDSGNRASDIVGSLSLVLAGYAMVWFAIAIAEARDNRRTPLVVTASLACGGMVIAGLALATVPLTISFGDLSDDPGLGVGQAVLPQFGYVSLVIGAMLPAAALVIVIARIPNLLPRWLSVAGYPVAALLLLAVMVMPMVLLAVWIAAVSIVLRRSPLPVALDHP